MSIIPLISSWEQYLQSHPAGNLQDFGRWLQTTFQPTQPPSTAKTAPSSEALSPASSASPSDTSAPSSASTPNPLAHARLVLGNNADLDAPAYGTLLVNRLGNINLFLSKPIIRKLGFAKEVEFGVLIQVYLMDHPNKKELSRRLLIEASTGVEITRRLAKKGLLRETIDPNDRRSARLTVTEKGMRLIKEGYTGIAPIHKEFLTPLEPGEQLQLVGMLARLYEYHSARIVSLIDRLRDRT
jgi:DNA-binding MarR family transcriptional regulator